MNCSKMNKEPNDFEEDEVDKYGPVTDDDMTECSDCGVVLEMEDIYTDDDGWIFYCEKCWDELEGKE